MAAPLLIDGSKGEGGGQIIRSAVCLAAILGRPITLDNIRAGRSKPGLAAQHLTSVRAAAALCRAELDGDTLGSTALRFAPKSPVAAGDYAFDVAEAREGGSAGAVTLVLQTVLPALMLADGVSTVTVRGGTQMAWSPPFHYLRDVWLPVLARAGLRAEAVLNRYGWFPVGQGEVKVTITGMGGGAGGNADGKPLRPLELVERGALCRVTGTAVAANLPAHIPQRMADRARAVLGELGAASDATPEIMVEITPERVRSDCPGAGTFLTAEYEGALAGFGALGARRKSSERVAEEAAGELLAFHRSGAAVDRHLADQLLLPLSFASGPSTLAVEQCTLHLETNAWLIGQFGVADIEITPDSGGESTGDATDDNDRPGTAIIWPKSPSKTNP